MAKHTAMLNAGAGSIVNISSMAILSGLPSYAPSKAGMNSLTCELAVLYGRRGIRVNTVAPGLISNYSRRGVWRDIREVRRKVAPLGNGGTSGT
jgi:NAD(P)-dependent dehydrogenase (short-subunit alcohol dehydrogenase family)